MAGPAKYIQNFAFLLIPVFYHISIIEKQNFECIFPSHLLHFQMVCNRAQLAKQQWK